MVCRVLLWGDIFAAGEGSDGCELVGWVGS